MCCRLTSTILGNMGFDVLEACDADQAIAVAQRFDGEIRMMLTDVIMPGMNGKELAERMARLRPQNQGRIYVRLHGPHHEPRRGVGRIGGVPSEAFHRRTVERHSTPCIGVVLPVVSESVFFAAFADDMREYMLND